MSFSNNSKRSVSEEEECKWEYFRKLKDLNDDQVNENDANLRKYINDIDQTQSSFSSDDMNAMERTLKLSGLRDEISENIVSKIEDPKDRMLVGLLYKVCTDLDPTRMQFIRFCVALKNHGILNNLNFLMSDNKNNNVSNTNNNISPIMVNNKCNKCNQEAEEQWTDRWSDEQSMDEYQNNNATEETNEEESIQYTEFDRIENISDQSDDEKNHNYNDNENENDLPLIRLISKNSNNSNITSRYNRDFEEIECIGFGAFGTVHKVKHKLDSAIYAIKKIIYKHDGMNYGNIKNQIITEIKNIAQLNHTNIVRYYTAWIENGPITVNNNNTVNTVNNNKTNTNCKTDHNVTSFFDYDMSNVACGCAIPKENRLNPTGSIPIVRTKSNEGLSLLRLSDATKSLISPYPSRHTSPVPSIINMDSCRQNNNKNPNMLLSYWKNQTAYSCLFLQTEYCGKYTLHDFINNPHRIPNRDDNMHIFAQILLGLAHIHSKLLLHRDLKPENIFLIAKNNINQNGHKQYTVKIGDFGLSKSLTQNNMNNDINNRNDLYNLDIDMNETYKSNNNTFTSNIGTNTYAAPEQLSALTYGTSADIYSLGIILFELIQPAFDTMMERYISITKFRNNNEIDLERINQQKFRKEIDLMIQMTNKKASLRPNAHSLILNEDIQIYWMQNILNDAIPHMAYMQTQQKSLPYNEKINNDNIEISLVTNQKNINTQKDSPTYLLTSPKAPPILSNVTMGMHMENK